MGEEIGNVAILKPFIVRTQAIEITEWSDGEEFVQWKSLLAYVPSEERFLIKIKNLGYYSLVYYQNYLVTV